MDKTHLKVTGWLVFTRIAISFSVLIFMIILQITRHYGPVWLLFRTVVSLGLALLYVYILYSFRRLLHEQYNFHGADTVIAVFAWLSLAGEVLDKGSELVALLNPEIKWYMAGLRVLVIIIPIGIIMIMYGLRMLKMGDAVSHILKLYSYSLVGTGICMVSVILLPFALILGLVMDILLGMIFFSAADDAEFV
ncbi:hypothetical protein JXO52_01600 [bacterium]|nr:hypothetical protein [bacterium]